MARAADAHERRVGHTRLGAVVSRLSEDERAVADLPPGTATTRLPGVTNDNAFSDVLTANQEFSSSYQQAALEARAARGLAVLTCMDSRIDPLRMLGLKAGDAKILRNAGARVTEDVLRTLVLASYLLGVDRVMVVAHTGCAIAGEGEEAIRAPGQRGAAADTRSIAFLTTNDQEAALRADIRSHPLHGPT